MQFWFGLLIWLMPRRGDTCCIKRFWLCTPLFQSHLYSLFSTLDRLVTLIYHLILSHTIDNNTFCSLPSSIRSLQSVQTSSLSKTRRSSAQQFFQASPICLNETYYLLNHCLYSWRALTLGPRYALRYSQLYALTLIIYDHYQLARCSFATWHQCLSQNNEHQTLWRVIDVEWMSVRVG